MATNRFSVISCMACIQPKRPFSNAPGSRRASTRRNVASEGMPLAKSRKRASHVLRSYPNSWIAAKELAPDSTPQTAMKTMLISGCLRVRSTRGSLRSWKWSWKAAGPSPGMIGSVGVRLRSLGDDTPLYAGAFPQATSDLYLDAAALLHRLLARQVLRPLQEAPPRPLQDRLVTITLQSFRFLRSDLVQRLAELLHHMEPVQDVNRLTQVLGDHVEVRLPHIAAHELHLLTGRFPETFQARTKAGLGPLLGHGQQPSCLSTDVVNQRQI